MTEFKMTVLNKATMYKTRQNTILRFTTTEHHTSLIQIYRSMHFFTLSDENSLLKFIWYYLT